MAKGICFMCGKWAELEEHHLFGGARRPISDKYGLTVKLCRSCHQDAPDSAHRSGETKLALHKYGQIKAMQEQGWNIEEFRERFGKNYLGEADIEAMFEPVPAGRFELTEDEEELPW